MSKFGLLNLEDIAKGAGITVAGSFISAIDVIVKAGRLPTITELENIATACISVGVAYLIKNAFTNSSGTFGTQEISPDKK